MDLRHIRKAGADEHAAIRQPVEKGGLTPRAVAGETRGESRIDPRIAPLEDEVAMLLIQRVIAELCGGGRECAEQRRGGGEARAAVE